MKTKVMTIISILLMINLSLSCYFDTAQDNPYDPANIDVISDQEAVTTDKLNTSIVYNGTDTSSSVKQNITLPVTGANGTTISWNSNNPSVVSNTGAVTRPDYFSGDASVTLTATIIKNSVEDVKTFIITVIKAPASDAQCVSEDKATLAIGYQGSDNDSSVTQNILLNTTGTSGTTISWSSSNTSVVKNTGEVIRPGYLIGNTNVTITATIVKNSSSDTKVFIITVIKAAITDADCVSLDKSALEIDFIGDDSAASVTGLLWIPTYGSNGTIISWASNDPSIVPNNESGLAAVYRPSITYPSVGSVNVVLTATIVKNSASDTRTFNLTVVKTAVGSIATGQGGGYIFIDKGRYSSDSEGNWRYMAAAPVDQSTGVRWNNGTNTTTGATSLTRGKSNTSAIIASQGSGTYAATIATSYSGGGYNDWFLPARTGLEAMYSNLAANGLGGFSNTWYWSSTEVDSARAWEIYFYSGSGGAGYKNVTSYSVRAVRVF